ncbi:MAG TPA: DoxX family protein [Candidatus Eremiobacteraceae bacterium]|nr:DoxX family protein [Candidatus Eremiobacteraceae bacterium]
MWKNYALAGLRIYLGIIFAIAVYPKLMAGSRFALQLNGFLSNVGLQNAHPAYQRFLTVFVIPHVATVALLVIIAETAVALTMIAGVATRLSAVVAMLLVTNYMLAKGLWWWNPSSNDGAFFMIALVLAICAAGRVFGVDSLLARRWPKSVLW